MYSKYAYKIVSFFRNRLLFEHWVKYLIESKVHRSLKVRKSKSKYIGSALIMLKSSFSLGKLY